MKMNSSLCVLRSRDKGINPTDFPGREYGIFMNYIVITQPSILMDMYVCLSSRMPRESHVQTSNFPVHQNLVEIFTDNFIENFIASQ